jgi:hypothetical protein
MHLFVDLMYCAKRQNANPVNYLNIDIRRLAYLRREF